MFFEQLENAFVNQSIPFLLQLSNVLLVRFFVACYHTESCGIFYSNGEYA
jgi:hypothetical protein